MKDASEDEEEDATAEMKNTSNALQTARIEREKKLREMMEDEDG